MFSRNLKFGSPLVIALALSGCSSDANSNVSNWEPSASDSEAELPVDVQDRVQRIQELRERREFWRRPCFF